MTSSDESALGVFGRQALRKIFGPLRVEMANTVADGTNIYTPQRIKEKRLHQPVDTSTLSERPGREGPGNVGLELSISNWHQTGKKKKRMAAKFAYREIAWDAPVQGYPDHGSTVVLH